MKAFWFPLVSSAVLIPLLLPRSWLLLLRRLAWTKDDIVFCGRQAIDGDTAQVGSQIAEKLNIPQVSYVADVSRRMATSVAVKRMLEDGHMTIETQTPCLLTCIKELNEPRYMSLKRHYGLLLRSGFRI